MATPPKPSLVIRFGAFELDAAARELRKGGVLLKLHPQPFRVLQLLAEQPGKIVPREEIRHYLWSDGTFVDFERGINFCVNQIRIALNDDAEKPRYIETIPRLGYRFIAPIASPDTPKPVTGFPSLPTPGAPFQSPRTSTGFVSARGIHVFPSTFPAARSLYWARRAPKALILALAALAILIAGTISYSNRKPKLTNMDTIVVTDFTNTTGDPVFDDTLKQGLVVQLEQSPYLNIISEEQVRQTLPLMGQPVDARLTPQLALQLCRRTMSAAVLQGSIARIDNQYVLGLKAVNCNTGESMTEEQVTAEGKGQVLRAPAVAATNARTKLGESRPTLQRFNTPIEQVTTPSLEALQAYSLGRGRIRSDDDASALPYLEHAVQLDPNFAMAYASLGLVYDGTGNVALSSQDMRKAYDLRSHVSEREKFYLEAHYYDLLTGDLEKARQTYELWEQIYPRDETPHVNLGCAIYCFRGEYEKALGEIRMAPQMNPTKKMAHAQAVNEYLALNRLDEAKNAAQEAFAKHSDSPFLRFALYNLAFLQSDPAGMKEQVAWSTGRSGVEHELLSEEASTAAYFGRFGQARELTRRAIASSERDHAQKWADHYEANQVFREALVGNLGESRRRAAARLQLSGDRYVPLLYAMTLVRVGETAKALKVADDAEKQFPDDSMVQLIWLPMIHAQVALQQNDSSKAIEVLQVTTPFELGTYSRDRFMPSVYPAYIRGEAFLAAGRGSEAAAEFQKILDHRGIIKNDLVGLLAHLELGRAYAMQGETVRAREAYQDFLTLWKDADADIPILKQAKSAYAMLQ